MPTRSQKILRNPNQTTNNENLQKATHENKLIINKVRDRNYLLMIGSLVLLRFFGIRHLLLREVW